MTTTLDELGCYLLAGQPERSRDIVGEVRAAEELGLGRGLHLRALQQEGGRRPVRGGRGGQRADPPSDRRHQPQHPPPDGHRRLRPHHAEPDRRPLRRSAWAGASRSCRTPTGSPGSPPPRWRTSPADAPAVPGRGIIGHDGPAGSYPVLHLDAALDEYLPARPGGLRGPHPGARPGGASTRSSCTPTSPTRPPGAAWTRSRRPPSRPAGTPTDVRVWSCFATIGDHLPEAAA